VCVCVCVIQDVTEAYADDMALARQRRNLPDAAVAQALVDAQARCVPPVLGVWNPVLESYTTTLPRREREDAVMTTATSFRELIS
jgi:hypothetical protein